MRSGLLRTVLTLAAGGLVLAGCASPVTGSASPGGGEPVDVPADQLKIAELLEAAARK